MGGGGDHGHHEPFKVPHWTTQANWRQYPTLVEYHKRLTRLGMRDPWMKNYTFKFNEGLPEWYKMGRRGIWRACWHFTRPGLLPGATLAGVCIAIEELYSKYFYGHTSWGGHWSEPHHDHGHDHHHEADAPAAAGEGGAIG